MLKIHSVKASTEVGYCVASINQGYNTAIPHLNGFAFTFKRKQLPLKTTLYRDSERLVQGHKYGDTEQTCNQVRHVALDGDILPPGLTMTEGRLSLPGTDKNGSIVIEPGQYMMVGRREQPAIGWQRHAWLTGLIGYEYFRNDKGVIFLGGREAYWTRWDDGKVDVPSTFSFNYRIWNFTGPIYDNYVSTYMQQGTYSEPNTVYKTLESYKVRLSIIMSDFVLNHLPTGEKIGSSGHFSAGKTLKLNRTLWTPSLIQRAVYSLLEWSPLTFLASQEAEKQLYADCLTGQSCFGSNSIAYISDIGKVGDSIRALLALVADPCNPKQWASVWLSSRFSDRLTYQDSKELLHSIRSELKRLDLKLSYRETHSRTTSTISWFWGDVDVTSHARLRCDNESMNTLCTAVKKLMDWDGWLTLENAWDLVPLSFVVDWFLNLSTILTNIDNLVYAQYLKVRIYERSDKVFIKMPPDVVAHAFGSTEALVGSSVTMRYYVRSDAPRPQLGIMDGWDPSLPAPVNYIDAGALLIQMGS